MYIKSAFTSFAGFGAVSGSANGAWFTAPEEGALAHLEHLYAYASKDQLLFTLEKIYPGFDLVTRGIALNWINLNGSWRAGLGEAIVQIYN